MKCFDEQAWLDAVGRIRKPNGGQQEGHPRLLALRVNHVRDALVTLVEVLHSTRAFRPLPKRNWLVIGQQRIAATLGS